MLMETNLSFDVKTSFLFFFIREKAIDSFAGEMRMLEKNEEAGMDGWMDGWMEADNGFRHFHSESKWNLRSFRSDRPSQF